MDVANSDGIDPDHCSNVRILGCHIECADDCICLKASKGNSEYGPCENIIISDCTLVSTSAAIKIGTEGVGDFRNIIVNNCIITKSNRGLSIQIRDGGNVENVTYSNCIIETRRFCPDWWGTAEPIVITTFNRDENTKSGKMSKSKGDFLTLARLQELGYSPMEYKFFCLQSHYRKQLVYSDESLDSAKSAYQKLIKRVSKLKEDDSGVDKVKFDEYRNRFNEALSNDLNTSYAVTVLFDVLKSDVSNNTKIALVKDFDLVFGLELAETLEKNKITEDENDFEIDPSFKAYIEEMIEKRKSAKQQKEYAAADSIRNKLLDEGVELIDTKEGTSFKIKKNNELTL